MAEIYQARESDHIQLVRGYPFPGAASFQKEVLEEFMDYVPSADDIIISSYPKTGTTWLQYIVLQIISKGHLFPDCDDLDQVCPYVENTGVSAIDTLKPPRTYMHHVPYNMLRKNDKAKTLYIYRRPEDTLVSYFHFLRNLGRDIDFNEHFENFLTGNIGYGRYFEHVLSYLAHKDDKNLLLISYEKLSANREEQIMRIAKFLGEEYANIIVGDHLLLNKIMELTSFSYMKTNLSVTFPVAKSGNARPQPQKIDFFRKGTVGEGKSSLSPEQMKRVKDMTKAIMKGTEILNEWLEE